MQGELQCLFNLFKGNLKHIPRFYLCHIGCGMILFKFSKYMIQNDLNMKNLF